MYNIYLEYLQLFFFEINTLTNWRYIKRININSQFRDLHVQISQYFWPVASRVRDQAIFVKLFRTDKNH